VPLSQIENSLVQNKTLFSHINIDENNGLAHFYLNETHLNRTTIFDPVRVTAHITTKDDYGLNLQKLMGNEYYSKNVSYIKTYDFMTMLWDIAIGMLLVSSLYSIASTVLEIFYPKKPKISEAKDKQPDDKTQNDSLFSLVFSNKAGTDTSNAFYQVVDKSTVSFSDVIGVENVKDDLKEFTRFIKYREQYVAAGSKIPKGILFSGPPGTGKTMLAKAFATECGAKFISTCASSFIQLYVGSGSKRIRELFDAARKMAPCVIFIDEIDAIGARTSGSRGNSEHNSTLNTFLSEMDGFKSNENILVIGTTNLPENLDSALMRSGRFDKKLFFDLPNLTERKELFGLYVDKVLTNEDFKLNKDNNIGRLAKMTAGLSGADVSNIVNQGINRFMKRQKVDLETNKITIDSTEGGSSINDFLDSIDEVMIGAEKKERIMTEKEKEYVAYHEAGHTLIGYLLKGTNPPLKTSIVPRGSNMLGFAQQEPDDRKLVTKNELLAQLYVLLAGRCAEKLIFKDVTTGAQDDFERASKIAYALVTKYGMNDDFGPLSLTYDKQSEWLKSSIDGYVKDLLLTCNRKVLDVLMAHREYLDKLAKKLLENEVLLKDDIISLVPESLRSSLSVA
jgi:ATP-dependent metalloprotease FtsH